MKKLLYLFFTVLFLMQISNAQSLDAKNLPLHILFHRNESGGNGWSPDGKTFIVYSPSEDSIKLWNLADDSVIWETSPNEAQKSNSVKSQTFVWSEDQKIIAVRNNNGKVFLLNSATGKIIWQSEAEKENLEMMKFTQNGKYLAAVISNKNEKAKIELWTTQTGKLEKTFNSEMELVREISLDKSGKVLAVGDFGGKINYIDFSSGKVIRRISLNLCGKLKDTYSRNSNFSPQLTYLVARCQENTVITDTATQKILSVIKMNADFEDGISFSGDEKILVLENLGGYKIFNFADKTIKEIEDGTSGELNVDGNLSISGSSYKNRGLEIREVKTGKIIKNFESHPGEIKNLVFNSDGSRFASASRDGIVRVWETKNHKIIWAKVANDEGTNAVTFSPDGKILVSAGDNENDINPIKVWDAENGNLLREVLSEKDGSDGIGIMSFSPNGKLLLTTGSSVAFKVWDVGNWKVLRTFQTNEEHQSGNMGWCCGSTAMSISFDKTGNRILSAHEDGTIKFWSIDKAEPIRILQVSDGAIRAHFSPDEKQILIIGANANKTKIIDAEGANVIQEYKTGNSDEELDNVTDAAFLSDGKSFITTSWFDDVMIWDASSNKILRRINVGWSTDDEIEMSPDGKYFLAGGENQNIMLFNASDGELIWSLFPINKELRRIKQAEEDKRNESDKCAEEYAARADVDNQERAKTITAKFSHYGDAESFWDQKIAESGAANKSKLKMPKEKAKVAWFTLTNDSDLPVSIDTNSMMFNSKCQGLCDGAEISSRYVSELKSGKTSVNGFDMFSKTILPPKRSVFFSVALEDFAKSKAIYLGFTFQKDNADGKDSDDYGTEQKLYLRETDLPK